MRVITNKTAGEVYIAGKRISGSAELTDAEYNAYLTDITELVNEGLISVSAWSADTTSPSSEEVLASIARRSQSIAIRAESLART